MSLLRYVNSTYVPNRASSTISVKSSSGASDGSTSMMFKTDNTSTGSSSNNQVTLPLESGGTYNMTVNWGDGTTSTITTYNQAEVTHTYSSIGTYNVKISGTCYGWRYNNSGDRLKLLEIKAWGNSFRAGNSTGNFYGCENLLITATDTLDLTGKTTLSNMFRSCTALTTAPSMSQWDTSAVTNMSNVFYSCTNFNQDISSWNTGNVTDMSSMFFGCTNFNQNIGSWNTAKVTLMNSMFQACTNFNQNIGSWDTSKVTNMSSLFYQCTNFNQNISSWNTGLVTNMVAMFYQCSNFNQNISGWNTGAVTSMISMFHTATSFNQNLGSWNVTGVTSMSNMFLNVTLSNSNYDGILNGWAAQAVKSVVEFNAGNSKYTSAGQTSRSTLINTYSWNVIDGGLQS